MSAAYDLFQQGRTHLRSGMPAQATVALEKAKRLEPEKASIREALGIAYFRLSRWSEAEDEFRKVLELSPADDYAHYALGRALRNQGRHDEARGHLKLARSLRPRGEGRAGPRRVRLVLGLEVGDHRRVAAEAPRGAGGERLPVRRRRVALERPRVRLAEGEQLVGDRVDDELEVAVRLLGVSRPARTQACLGLGGLGEQLRLVLGEERELSLDELGERRLPAPEPHTSSW